MQNPQQNPDVQVVPKLTRGRMLRVNRVAALLDMSERTVRYLAENGILPGFKLGRREWRFWESDIHEYIRTRQAR